MVEKVKGNLKLFYEEEARRLSSHQDFMYLKGNKYELWWHRKRLRYILSFLSEIFGQDSVMTFVDVGCAEGYYVKIVAKMQKETFCVGADIARTYVEKAKKNCNLSNVDYVVCDVENSPFKTESIDIVLCSEVLEHVFNYKSAIFELFRISGKHLVVSFPGHTFVYKFIRKIKPLQRLSEKMAKDVGHISEVKIEDLREKVGNYASFQIKIGGSLPLQLVRLIPSIKLVELIDELICGVLIRLNMVEYVTIHVVKVTR
ncbi:MAG: class I SAM-dependent methyltransferase [Candidatus Bathyarchaeia archaeon]